MPQLYVVRRDFKAHGILFETGNVIDDPSSIKLFRSRLIARDIIELGEDNAKSALWLEYLESRTHKPLESRIYLACDAEVPAHIVAAELAVKEAKEAKEAEEARLKVEAEKAKAAQAAAVAAAAKAKAAAAAAKVTTTKTATAKTDTAK